MAIISMNANSTFDSRLFGAGGDIGLSSPYTMPVTRLGLFSIDPVSFTSYSASPVVNQSTVSNVISFSYTPFFGRGPFPANAPYGTLTSYIQSTGIIPAPTPSSIDWNVDGNFYKGPAQERYFYDLQATAPLNLFDVAQGTGSIGRIEGQTINYQLRVDFRSDLPHTASWTYLAYHTGNPFYSQLIAGDDTVNFGNGNDYFIDTNGSLTLNAGGGDDEIIALNVTPGATDIDWIDGGDGNDLIYFQNSGHTILGGNGNDRILGQGNNSPVVLGMRVDGGAGNDFIEGNGAADTLIGGDGDDTIDGKAGVDVIIGGPGADKAYAYGQSVFLVNGTGDVAFGDFVKGQSGQQSILAMTDTTDFNGMTWEGIARFEFRTSSNASATFYNGSYNRAPNIILGSAFVDTLMIDLTGSSDWSFYAHSFENWTDQTDQIILKGTAGNNKITGSSFSEKIFGNDGVDTIDAGAGNDAIDGGVGVDSLNAGLGNDDVIYDAADTLIDGGGGLDILRITADVTVNLDNVADQVVGGGITTGFEGVDFSSLSGGVVFRATVGDNTLIATASHDSILGLSGSDIISGLADNDTLLGDGTILPTDNALSVKRLYLATLGRWPDDGGWAGWTAELDGGKSVGQIAPGFVNSAEFQQKYGALDNTAFVTLLYANVMHRAPDSGGLSHWTGLLGSGTSRADVVTGFSESAELRISTDTELNTGKVYRLYGATLNRQPDSGGLEYWVDQIGGGRSLDEAAAGFVNSAEFTATYGALSNGQFVSLLYQNVLGRTATQGEIDAWVGEMAGGKTRTQVVLGFSESLEYGNGTKAPMISYMRSANSAWNDTLDGGAGDDTSSGGIGGDTFVFDKSALGTSDHIYEWEAWDQLQLTGFGYANAAAALSHMTQQGDNVIFTDQGETITLHSAKLSEITVMLA